MAARSLGLGVWQGAALFLVLAASPLAAAAQLLESDPSETGGVTATDAWEEGLRLRRSGEWEAALDLWEDASEDLSGEGLHDLRIGLAFVETAVENDAEDRYGTASSMVLWGLGNPSVPGTSEALADEVSRLELVWTPAEKVQFEDAAAAGDEALRLALKTWWIEKDPTPATAENERLIEHWTRIRDARERFTYNRSSVIGTDERGEIYLRYGEPARIDRGSLGANEAELRLRVPDNIAARQRLRGYDPNPQYSVWVYEDLNSEGFTYFLFGNVDGTGPFQLVDGVTDLISPEARSRNSSRGTPGGIPASFYLELFYYADLSVVGGHFARRFSELEQRWDYATYRRRSFVSAAPLTPPESSLEALRFRYQDEDKYAPPNPPQVNSTSALEGAARDEMVAQMIRTLSDDGVPLLVLVGTSAPRLIAQAEDAADGEIEFPEWVMRHTLVIRDSKMDEVGRLVQPISALRADVSSFILRHVPEPLHLTMTAKTLRISADQQDTLVAGDRLPGLQHFTPAVPLQAEPDELVLSDLMTGTLIPDQINPAALPYPLLPTRKLWRSDALRLYLEFFGFAEAPDTPGTGDLAARFVVIPLRPDLQADLDRDPVTLSVSLSPRAGRPYREFFDMQLRDQDLGYYRVEVEVRDAVTGVLQRRSAVIELVD